MEPLRIAYVSSELAPHAKAGGLADVAAALPAELARRGHDVRVFVPLYDRMRERGVVMQPLPQVAHVPLVFGSRRLHFSLARGESPGGADVYYVDCPALYHRGGIYTADGDEHVRFLMLTRAVLESCQRLQWGPHVFHVNDWQTSLLPIYLKTLYAWDRLLRDSRTLLTLHNVGYQGVFGREALTAAGLDNEAHLFHQQDLDRGFISFLRTGIIYADALTTVSPTYAQEIQTEAYGMGLQDLLRSRRSSLFGVLNGVDYDEWDPAGDRFLAEPYTAATLDRKEVNRRYLLDRVGLGERSGIPILGLVSRLSAQKGLELCLEVLPALLRRRQVRLVVLGSGEDRYEHGFAELQRGFPADVCFYRGFNNELAHLIEAGADVFVMPSRYEPCGLNQMYSLRYGTVPVVRRTGGLADSVEQIDAAAGTGTGILFDHLTATGLRWALDRAISLYKDRATWRQIQLNGMAKDFSWERQADPYEELYRRLAGHRPQVNRSSTSDDS